MHNRWLIAAPALLSLSLLVGPAEAQFPGTSRGPVNPFPNDSRGGQQGFQIKRRFVNGVVKSRDAEKKVVVLNTGGEKQAKELPVEVGPCRIFAGPGKATLADIQVGDKVRIYGESTIQGGLRAMDVWLPKERMSIPPPEKPKKIKLTPEEKKAKREADKVERAAAEEKRKADKVKREAEKAEKEAAEKVEKEAKREAAKAEREAAKAKANEEKAEKAKLDAEKKGQPLIEEPELKKRQ